MALIISLSGIRGVFGKDLTESIAVKYAYTYASFIKSVSNNPNPVIVIGADTRPSGALIRDSIIGVLDCSFINVGIATTPLIQFAVRNYRADGGIIITASHNEPYWNGFKFLGNSGAVITEKEINQVAANYSHFRDFHKIQERKIFDKGQEALKKYSDFILNFIGSEAIGAIRNSNQNIVVDPNGGTGSITTKILEQLGIKFTAVNTTYGEFSRKVEPTEDSLIYLKNIIDDKKADFAAGFDCDADRVEILLGNGQLMSGNYTLALIANELLSKNKDARNKFVVVNNATSNVVRKVVEQNNSRLVEVEAGESNVVEAMARHKAVLGGEGSSGGVILPPSTCRDGILTLVMLLSIVAKRKKELKDLIEELPRYYTLKTKIEFEHKKYNSIRNQLKSHYSKKGFEIEENGGVKGSLKIKSGKNSFVWFRASKTEGNYFRIIADSNKKEEAKKLMEEAVDIFNKANEHRWHGKSK